SGPAALRRCVMLVAPPENEVEWTDSGLEGSFRFLGRVWRLVEQWIPSIRSAAAGAVDAATLNPAEKAVRRKTHDTIRRVTADIEQRQQLNTAVSAMMELVNELYAVAATAASDRPETQRVMREAIEALVRMISPFAPHTAEELWEQ